MKEKNYTGFILSCTTNKVELYKENQSLKSRKNVSRKNSDVPRLSKAHEDPEVQEDPKAEEDPEVHQTPISAGPFRREIDESKVKHLVYIQTGQFKLITGTSLLKLLAQKKEKEQLKNAKKEQVQES